jgi:hypothetical protein
MDQQGPGGVGEQKEGRRSRRFPLIVQVEVSWTDAKGQQITEQAVAHEVNTFGGFLKLTQIPRSGDKLSLKNPASGETAEARVIAVRYSKAGERLGVAIELERPSETFWGMTFQLKRTTAELVRLEEELKSGGIDQRVLQDFRDAVDYVRKTAWVVYEWQERQAQHRDTATILPLLTLERIRRARQLCRAIVADVEAHDAELQSASIAEFVTELQSTLARLVQLGSVGANH